MRRVAAKLIRAVASKDSEVARTKYGMSFNKFYRMLKKMYKQGDKNERREKLAEIRRICSC